MEIGNCILKVHFDYTTRNYVGSQVVKHLDSEMLEHLCVTCSAKDVPTGQRSVAYSDLDSGCQMTSPISGCAIEMIESPPNISCQMYPNKPWLGAARAKSLEFVGFWTTVSSLTQVLWHQILRQSAKNTKIFLCLPVDPCGFAYPPLSRSGWSEVSAQRRCWSREPQEDCAHDILGGHRAPLGS